MRKTVLPTEQVIFSPENSGVQDQQALQDTVRNVAHASTSPPSLPSVADTPPASQGAAPALRSSPACPEQQMMAEAAHYFSCPEDKEATDPLKNPQRQEMIRRQLNTFKDIDEDEHDLPSMVDLLRKKGGEGAHDLLKKAYKYENPAAAILILQALRCLKEERKRLSEPDKEWTTGSRISGTILGRAPLWTENRPGWLPMLLASGVLDVNYGGPHYTPLATALGHAPDGNGMKALLSAGADPNQVDWYTHCARYTALHIALESERLVRIPSSIRNKNEKVDVLLSDPRTDPNLLSNDDKGESFLHKAVRTRYLPGVKRVLESPRVDPNVVSQAPRVLHLSPLAMAATKFLSPGNMPNKDDVQIIRELLKAGAQLVMMTPERKHINCQQDLKKFIEAKKSFEEDDKDLASRYLDEFRSMVDSLGNSRSESKAELSHDEARKLNNDLKTAFKKNKWQDAIEILAHMKRHKPIPWENSSLSHDPEFWKNSTPGWRKMLIESKVFELDKNLNSSTGGMEHQFTPLALACLPFSDSGAVKDLLDQDVSPNRIRPIGKKETPLHALLDRRLNLYVEATPLPSALDYVYGPEQHEKLDMLLSHPEIDPNIKNKNGEYPLNLLVMDMKEDSVLSLEMLLQHPGVKPNMLSTMVGHSSRDYVERPDGSFEYLSALAEAVNLFLQSSDPHMKEILTKKIRALVQADAKLMVGDFEYNTGNFRRNLDDFIRTLDVKPVSLETKVELYELLDENIRPRKAAGSVYRSPDSFSSRERRQEELEAIFSSFDSVE